MTIAIPSVISIEGDGDANAEDVFDFVINLFLPDVAVAIGLKVDKQFRIVFVS